MLTFSVSRDRDTPHFVDLLSLQRGEEFNGRCDCWKFVKTFLPRFEDKMPISSLTRCEHIRACRDAFTTKAIGEVAEMWKGKDEDSL
tara:strand:- start:138 stop:398 length:261 start_codon:yes stop_codon:yes gene_type:complete